MADTLGDVFCIITRYCNFSIFKMAALHHLGVLKLKFLTVCTSEIRSASLR